VRKLSLDAARRIAVRATPLDRLLCEERALFTWRAFLYPLEDWPLVGAADLYRHHD
jgi:hypothetical protein